jgi:exopolysaccharide production protein ExoZ
VIINNIQVLRAFAAVSVIFFHSLIGIRDYEFQLFAKFFDLGDFGVDIFFVISGFIMVFIKNKYKRNSINFISQRLKRIVPLYWFFNFLILFLFLLFPSIFNTLQISFYHFFLSLFFLSQYIFLSYPIVTAGWTLEYEFFFYILFAIFININNVRLFYFTIFSIIIFFYFLGAVNAIFIEFLFGMIIGIIYIYKNKLQKKILKNYCYYFIIFGFIFLLVSVFTSLEIHRLIKYGFPSSLIVLGCIFAKQISNKYAILIGNASYSIYLAQGFFIPASLKFFKIFFYDLNVIVIFTILLIGSLLFGLFIYYFIDRNLNLLIKKLII